MYGDYPATKIIAELSHNNLLPAILFRSARRQCDGDIEKLRDSRVAKLSQAEQNKIISEVQRVVDTYQMDHSIIKKHPHYQALVETGCGAHHAGQLLLWRLLLEELMTRGVLKMMIATGTVAAGVDFPARTVVVTAHSKRGSEGFNVITSSELQQMAGRAGRRGKDAVGICLIAPSVYSDARILLEVINRPPEPLRSSYFAAPATVLNLLKYRCVEDLRYTVQKSLAAFLDQKQANRLRKEVEDEQGSLTSQDLTQPKLKQIQKKLRRKEVEADDLQNKQALQLQNTLNALQQLEFLKDGVLTEKGGWAANLCTSLVLELSEAIAAHLFSDLTITELLAVVGSIAGDPHRAYFSLKKNPIKKEYFTELEKIVAKVRAVYQSPATNELAVIPSAALTVLTWSESSNWNEFAGLLRLNGVAEGDAARLILQTADHLGQIARLYDTHRELAEAAVEARRLLLRPPLSDTYMAG